MAIPDLAEDDKIDRFVRGLKAGPAKDVVIKRCQTFEEAMAVAKRVDVVLYSMCSWGQTTLFSTDSAPATDGPVPMEIGQVTQEFQGSCCTCGEWGHHSDECPRRARPIGAGRGRGRGRGRRTATRTRVNVVKLEEQEEGSEQGNEEPQEVEGLKAPQGLSRRVESLRV